MAPLLRWTGLRRLGAAHLLIDESTAMSVTREHTAAARVGFLTTGPDDLRAVEPGDRCWVPWRANAIGDPRALRPRRRGRPPRSSRCCGRGSQDGRNRVVALLGAAVALGLVPVTTAGVPVLAAGGRRPAGRAARGGHDDPTEIPSADDLPGGDPR